MSENEQKTGASTPASTEAFGAVPATVSGLRALLAEGMLDGIRVMHDTRGDFNRLYRKYGRDIPMEQTLEMGKQVDQVIQKTENRVAATFPRHWAENSPARAALKQLVLESFMAGMRSCATASTAGRRSLGREQHFGGTLPPDPQWMADVLNVFLEVTLPGLQRRGVPIMGTAQFLEERGLSGR